MVIIPARGGSKGIPRKNLRDFLGKPLIYYAIQAAKASKCSRVIVSTDDDEIALISEFFGAEVIKRSPELSGDDITIDQVIASIPVSSDKIITVQPTSPFVTAEDINKALEVLDYCDSVVSVVEDTHIRWGEAGLLTPRLNRQFLPKTYRETGAVIGCTQKQLKTGSRVGGTVRPLLMPKERSIDLDDVIDWNMAESINIKTIVFRVIGRKEVGMGHIYRSLTIANELAGHNVIFVCNEEDDLAISYIRSKNYPVLIGEKHVNYLNPDLVIHDILDTTQAYRESLPCPAVYFEDFNNHFAINDLYSKGAYSGHEYYCLRDEFMYSIPEPEGGRILVAFGGVDENNLTVKVLNKIKHIGNIDVITGYGYSHHEEIKECIKDFDVNHISNTNRISDYMKKAWIGITSGGRTVYELQSLLVPTIVIHQNEREKSHEFKYAFVLDSLEEVEKSIFIVNEERDQIREMMRSLDLKSGKIRVMRIIYEALYHC